MNLLIVCEANKLHAANFSEHKFRNLVQTRQFLKDSKKGK